MLNLETCKRLEAAGLREQVDFLRCTMWLCDCGPDSGYKYCHGFSEINGDPLLKYEHFGPSYPCPNSDELDAALHERFPGCWYQVTYKPDGSVWLFAKCDNAINSCAAYGAHTSGVKARSELYITLAGTTDV